MYLDTFYLTEAIGYPSVAALIRRKDGDAVSSCNHRRRQPQYDPLESSQHGMEEWTQLKDLERAHGLCIRVGQDADWPISELSPGCECAGSVPAATC